MKEDVASVRTFALISHGGAGKTSLAEAMLFNAGATTRLGKVDESTSVLDFEPEEMKRKATISSSFYSFTWKKQQFTLIDTPGDFNFISETKTSMLGGDGVIVLADAVDGVRVQTEIVWEFAQEFGLPKMIFINKMDRERADFAKTVQSLQNIFGKSCVPLQIPIGAAETFAGVVDLMSGKAFVYAAGENGKFETKDMPSELADEAAQYRKPSSSMLPKPATNCWKNTSTPVNSHRTKSGTHYAPPWSTANLFPLHADRGRAISVFSFSLT